MKRSHHIWDGQDTLEKGMGLGRHPNEVTPETKKQRTFLCVSKFSWETKKTFLIERYMVITRTNFYLNTILYLSLKELDGKRKSFHNVILNSSL